MRSGQVMLITSLLMAGMLLGATVVAGLLTVSQLRQVTDISHSAKAIFAADAGVELERYRWYQDRNDCHGNSLPAPPPFPASNPNPTSANPFVWERTQEYPASLACTDSALAIGVYDPSATPNPTVATYAINGASFSITTYAYRTYISSAGNIVTELDHIKVIGKSLNSARAFKATF